MLIDATSTIGQRTGEPRTDALAALARGDRREYVRAATLYAAGMGLSVAEAMQALQNAR